MNTNRYISYSPLPSYHCLTSKFLPLPLISSSSFRFNSCFPKHVCVNSRIRLMGWGFCKSGQVSILPQRMHKFSEYVEALEVERRKIQVFQRELPLCFELVSQVATHKQIKEMERVAELKRARSRKTR